MKKIKVLGVVLFIIAGLSISAAAVMGTRDITAQILTIQGNSQVSFLLENEVEVPAPQAKEFLNTFNLYNENTTELDLLMKYSHLLKFNSAEKVIPYLNEIMSYMERMNKNPELDAQFFDVLPLWPEYNVATYGNVLAYLFPEEKNPLAFAVENGLVPSDVKPAEYMSRKGFVELLGKIFIATDEDPLTVFSDLGFIDSRELWSMETKNGFLVVDGIRLILNVRELIERKQITDSKKAYERKLVDLPPSSLELNEKTIEVVLQSLQMERHDDRKVTKKVREGIISQFRSEFGKTLTAGHIEKLRNAYYERMPRSQAKPSVYELPATQFVGDCANELFRKTYMGSFVKTGINGAMISCDNIIIQLPKNAYILNLFSLPKVAVYPSFKDGSVVLRSDALKSFENTLIVGPTGEELVKVVYHPENTTAYLGKTFGYAVADQENNQILNGAMNYTENGAELKIHLRTFTGDNLVYFDTLVE